MVLCTCMGRSILWRDLHNILCHAHVVVTIVVKWTSVCSFVKDCASALRGSGAPSLFAECDTSRGGTAKVALSLSVVFVFVCSSANVTVVAGESVVSDRTLSACTHEHDTVSFFCPDGLWEECSNQGPNLVTQSPGNATTRRALHALAAIRHFENARNSLLPPDSFTGTFTKVVVPKRFARTGFLAHATRRRSSSTVDTCSSICLRSRLAEYRTFFHVTVDFQDIHTSCPFIRLFSHSPFVLVLAGSLPKETPFCALQACLEGA